MYTYEYNDDSYIKSFLWIVSVGCLDNPSVTSIQLNNILAPLGHTIIDQMSCQNLTLITLVNFHQLI